MIAGGVEADVVVPVAAEDPDATGVPLALTEVVTEPVEEATLDELIDAVDVDELVVVVWRFAKRAWLTPPDRSRAVVSVTSAASAINFFMAGDCSGLVVNRTWWVFR